MAFHNWICPDNILQFFNFVHVIAQDIRFYFFNTWNFDGNRFVSRRWLFATFKIALDNCFNDFNLCIVVEMVGWELWTKCVFFSTVEWIMVKLIVPSPCCVDSFQGHAK
jgi:hypothetical protein